MKLSIKDTESTDKLIPITVMRAVILLPNVRILKLLQYIPTFVKITLIVMIMDS